LFRFQAGSQFAGRGEREGMPMRGLIAPLTAALLALAASGEDTAEGQGAGKHRKPHLVVVVSEDEYRTHETLPELAARHLRDFKVTFVFGDKKDPDDLRGTEALATADVALFSVWRRTPPKAQMDAIRKFVAGGKPVVGIRTASHAFVLRGGKAPPAGRSDWPGFDRDVLGGNYVGHHGNSGPKSPRTLVRVLPAAAAHPVLTGLPAEEFAVRSWLYKTSPLGKMAVPLLTGRVEGRPMPEPVAWVNRHTGGGRVFYTSLGHPDDFRLLAFRRLLVNGIYWASGLEVPATLPDSK
jgi:type 1 glutamine amidotransferase